MVLNPSTDLLVTAAQYGPVIEAPPAMHEEDETKNLMSNENKEMWVIDHLFANIFRSVI